MSFGVGSGPGSDYAKQVEIQVLKETVSELRTEVGKLDSEAQKWKFEVEKLGVDPNYLTRLEEKVRRLEREAGDAQSRVRAKFDEIAALESEAEQMQRLADAFGTDAETAFFRLKSAWDDKQRAKTIVGTIGGFVAGIVASIVAAYLGLVLPGLGQ